MPRMIDFTMNTRSLLSCWALMGFACCPAVFSAEPGTPSRLKRADSFLGVHFDFHAGPDCKEVGKNTTPEMVAAILDQVKPDYIQIDCKGHAGYTSYPTKVGNPAPGFVGDPLRVWREVTAARGVALYLHYSGVWDSRALELHPEWAAINADGTTNKNATSVFGPYVDQLLIPQLRELAGEYGVDGAWVDGDCWATVPDYGAAAVRAFRTATGIQEIPRRPGEPHWFEWMEFHREGFRNYVRRYVNEVKRTHPRFEIASNWAFSDHMPEPVSAAVAFLSGDFSPQNSVNSARFSARCLANQGVGWDLMAWSFANVSKGPRQNKSGLQLQREAALVLAQGGGFQAYITQRRDGSVDLAKIGPMAEAAKFCRERQALAHRAQIVPQVALLYSRASHHRQSPQLFVPNSSTVRSLRGALQGLVESQVPLQIVSEHHLRGKMADWPVIVLPECEYLEPEFREELLGYVRQGGTLLVLGARCATNFSSVIEARWNGSALAKETVRLAWRGQSGEIATSWAVAQPTGALKTLGTVQSTNQGPVGPAATISSIGKGRLAVVWANLAERAGDTKVPVAREFLESVLHEIFPNPMVAVTGSRGVDVSLARHSGQLLVHLVNTSGPHATEPFVDALTPVGPLEVTLRVAASPKRVRLEPGGQNLNFTHADGVLRCRVESVPVHSMVVVE